ncbi:MAG: hypothetical protein IKH73_07545 [Erysipelotrichaceae bacterium]|nr:hypothetical protein [Erysipelotrichaceae bacterium]
MLESMNDIMSVLAIVVIMIAMILLVFHAISISVTARHLREEADYYSINKFERLEEK